MKNIIKNILNAVVNFFIYIFLIIFYFLKGVTDDFQDWTFTLPIILIICMLCYPV